MRTKRNTPANTHKDSPAASAATQAARALGRLGGLAGRGPAKARPRAKMAAAARKRWQKYHATRKSVRKDA